MTNSEPRHVAQLDQQTALADDLVGLVVSNLPALLAGTGNPQAHITALCERVFALDEQQVRDLAVHLLIELAGYRYREQAVKDRAE